AMRIDQPLLDRMIERRTVPETLTEALRPGVDMRVEMYQRQRALPRRQRAQEAEGHGVVAAERDEMAQRLCLRLDCLQRALDIAMGDAEIADIGDVLPRFVPCRCGAGDRVVAIDQH